MRVCVCVKAHDIGVQDADVRGESLLNAVMVFHSSFSSNIPSLKMTSPADAPFDTHKQTNLKSILYFSSFASHPGSLLWSFSLFDLQMSNREYLREVCPPQRLLSCPN
ncbi:hypothetical protein ILYODFUR_026956 [Ilyodon furcidens]|uniref:Uncharacterized protein n=1 Tax=Ilyodon furcidens TaxID=33524 RepID=A0ABV0SQA7_9TELE